jgi:Flp pilus assembly pilin Flp
MRSRAKLSQERGATMIEYALLIAFLALLTGVAVKAMGVGSQETFNSTASQLNVQGASAPGVIIEPEIPAGGVGGPPVGGGNGVGNTAR